MRDTSQGNRGHAALLLDVESFLLGREERLRSGGEGAGYEVQVDLEALLRFANDMAEGRRFVVRRAYADFNAARRVEDRWDYYLRPAAKASMELGIEPVQCFRFPGAGRRSAVDVRLAIDAMDLARSDAGVDTIVFVTGDTDLVPLAIELRATGVEVVVIGVTEHTRDVTQSYCDVFEYFEDLLAAQPTSGPPELIDRVRVAVHALLARKGSLLVAALRPMLNRELGQRFDPARFECEDLPQFLDKFVDALGIQLRGEGADLRIEVAPATGFATSAPSMSAEPRIARHDPSEYRWLLRLRSPKVHIVDHDDWLRITGLTFERCVGQDGEPIRVQHASLVEDITQQCVQEGMEAAEKKVQSVAFQLFKAGVFVCVGATGSGTRDFHWSKPARLGPEVRSVADMRRLAAQFVIGILIQRLREEYATDQIDSDVLAEVLEGPAHGADSVKRMSALVAAVRDGGTPAPV
ncbi:MAG: NYN domain-containing protein [Planctomycetota bacterium]